jgi:nucleoside-diphosphate-sugar epimerase
VRRAVFVGSTGVYTRLVSSGADAKRAGEARLRASSLSYTILRPSMIYGTPRDRNLVRLLRWLERCPLVPVPAGGRTAQQPVHVEDLCQAILAALEREQASRREYDLGGDQPLALADLIREAARALSRPVWMVPVPLGPAHALAVMARRARLPFPVSPEQVLRLAESKAVDIRAAGSELDFRPRGFRAGIEAEVRLLRAL